MARKTRKSSSNGPLLLIGAGVLLFVILLVYLAITGYNSGSSDTGLSGGESSHPEVARVSLADSKAAYDAKSAIFVDVRDASSFAAEHIPGAINIPLAQIDSRSNELQKDQWIITYCT